MTDFKIAIRSQFGCCASEILALGIWWQENQQFKVIYRFLESSRSTQALWHIVPNRNIDTANQSIKETVTIPSLALLSSVLLVLWNVFMLSSFLYCTSYVWEWDSKFRYIRNSRNTVLHHGNYLYICHLLELNYQIQLSETRANDWFGLFRICA